MNFRGILYGLGLPVPLDSILDIIGLIAQPTVRYPRKSLKNHLIGNHGYIIAEVNLFWAMGHQVHHSSEEYNLTTALRQGVWQGWSTFVRKNQSMFKKLAL